MVGSVVYYYTKEYSPKYRWNEDYTCTNDQPYGLKFLYDVLSKSRPKSDFVILNKAPKFSLNGNDSSALYIFIGSNFYCDSLSSERLVDFVHRGNAAYISSSVSTHYIFSLITHGKKRFVHYKNYIDSIIDLTFSNARYDSSYKFEYKQFKKIVRYRWAGIDSLYFADSLSIYGFERIEYSKLLR